MKTEFVDVSETRKNLVVEIDSSVVDAEIDRVARDYSRAARIPGFRPGKVPPRVVKQRFRDRILHDVVHELVPRAVDDALRERGVEPVDTPDIRDVVVEEGQPLRFTASFETVPPFELGDFGSLRVRKATATLEEGAVDQALERLREQTARYEAVDNRTVEQGDSVVIDLLRESPGEDADRHDNVTVDIGGSANPPGFDDQVVGMAVGSSKTFTIQYPDDYTIKELAGTSVAYTVTVKSIKKRVVPQLDDEFARDLGEFDTLEALRERVTQDLTREAELRAERDARADLLKQLAGWVTFELPSALIERELDRRVEEFARRLMEQGIDPRQADIDWRAFRESQQDSAREAVAGALVLDEVARRENVTVSADEIEAEIARYAERTGRTSAAVRANLEKDGSLTRLASGLRREKVMDLVRTRATVVE
jgi:trigger factor